MAKRIRRLKNLDIEEVSFVDKPANLKPFLFTKAEEEQAEVEKEATKLSVKLDSDGTSAGTKISVNGQAVKNCVDFSCDVFRKGLMPGSSEGDVGLFCRYSIEGEEDSSGFRAMTTHLLQKAVWTTAYVNNLPDSAFLYVESGGKKDDEGKTVPRGLRHFPYKDANGKVDQAHLKNAIARIPQAKLPAELKTKLQAKAKKMYASNFSKALSEAAEAVFAKLLGEEMPEEYDADLAELLAKRVSGAMDYWPEMPAVLQQTYRDTVLLALQSETAEEIEGRELTVKAENEEMADEPKTEQGKTEGDVTVLAEAVANKLQGQIKSWITEAVQAAKKTEPKQEVPPPAPQPAASPPAAAPKEAEKPQEEMVEFESPEAMEDQIASQAMDGALTEALAAQ